MKFGNVHKIAAKKRLSHWLVYSKNLIQDDDVSEGDVHS